MLKCSPNILNIEIITIKFNNDILEDLDGNKLSNSETSTQNPTQKEFLDKEIAVSVQNQATAGIISLFIAFATAFIIIFLLGKYDLNTLLSS